MRHISRGPYPSDLSDEQWGVIEDLIPKPNPHPNFPKDEYPRREIVNAILYLLRTGCPWRHLPHDLPPWTLVAHYFYEWKHGVIDAVADRLRALASAAQGRSATPTLGIIDSQAALYAPSIGDPSFMGPSLLSLHSDQPCLVALRALSAGV